MIHSTWTTCFYIIVLVTAALNYYHALPNDILRSIDATGDVAIKQLLLSQKVESPIENLEITHREISGLAANGSYLTLQVILTLVCFVVTFLISGLQYNNDCCLKCVSHLKVVH